MLTLSVYKALYNSKYYRASSPEQQSSCWVLKTWYLVKGNVEICFNNNA